MHLLTQHCVYYTVSVLLLLARQLAVNFFGSFHSMPQVQIVSRLVHVVQHCYGNVAGQMFNIVALGLADPSITVLQGAVWRKLSQCGLAQASVGT